MLKAGGLDAHLVGNIGNPPLPLLRKAGESSIFVFELSAQQLETLRQEPAHCGSAGTSCRITSITSNFENYVQAKQNLARYQMKRDYLDLQSRCSRCLGVSHPRHAPNSFPVQLKRPLDRGCFIEEGHVVCRLGETEESVGLMK